MRIVFALTLLVFTLHAGDDAKPRLKLSDEVQAIVDMTRSAAPEIHADTIVKLVDSGKVAERELQVELLEDAFHAATRAAEGVRLTAMQGTPSDTREIYRSKAGALGLDTISLQARVLRSMLTVDRGKARELFDQMRRPVLDPRSCEDALVADDTPYYEVAVAIAQSALAEHEREHVQFLAGLGADTKSPIEVAAFAGAIRNVMLSAHEWELMFAVTGKKLESVGADYRSFATSFNTMQSAVSTLVALGRANKIESAAMLTESFRNYVVAQMSAPRCQPDIPMETASYLEGVTMPKIEKKGSVQAHAYFDSADAKSIGEHLTRLTAKISDDEFSDLLKEYKEWTPSGSDVDILHQKATVLKALLQKRMTDAQQNRVATLAVELLATSGAQRSNPAEWVWQVREFAGSIGSLSEPGRVPALLIYLIRNA